MSPCRLSSRWWNLTTGRRALLTTWTLCTLGTQRFRIIARSSRTSAGAAVDRSISDSIESSDRPSSDTPSPGWRKRESHQRRLLYRATCVILWPNVRIEPVLWLTWHEPGTPWCVLGLRTGPGHMNGCQTCWQMNQMGESGCLQTTQHMATKVRKTFPSALFPSPICMQDLCTGIYKDHLGKTLQKSPAWVEPASFGHSFHFLPAEIAQQHAASGRSPRGEQRATP